MNVLPSFLLSTLLAASFPVFAQQATPAPKVEPPKAPEPDLAMLRAMKSKLFVLQHRDSLQLQRSLSALGSGANGATMRWTNENGLNTLTVRDFPENLASIEEAIRRLDVATPAQQTSDVELHIHILFASKSPSADGSLPEELQDVLKAMKGVLAYRSYTLAGTFVQRAGLQSAQAVSGGGLIDPLVLGPSGEKNPAPLTLDWAVYNGVSLEVQKEGPATIRMKAFRLFLREKTETENRTLASFNCDLTCKEGEKVVVGTSVIKDRGLIVVLTARRVN